MSLNKNLTPEEKKVIEEKVLAGWTDEKISDLVGRNTETVRRFRIKHLGIRKDPVSKGDPKNVAISKQAINRSNLSDEEKMVAWKNLFKKTERFKRLAKELIKEDLDYFVESWARYSIQFDDLTATEEQSLESLITIELRMSENRIAVRQIKEREMEIQQMLNGRDDAQLDLENENDRFYFEASQANNMLMQEKNKEYHMLSDRQEKLIRMLNATREQREQNSKIGADTFLSLVRALSEMDTREKAGKYAELMKRSTEKKRKELEKLQQFEDGNQRPIIMAGESYVKKEEEKND